MYVNRRSSYTPKKGEESSFLNATRSYNVLCPAKFEASSCYQRLVNAWYSHVCEYHAFYGDAIFVKTANRVAWLAVLTKMSRARAAASSDDILSRYMHFLLFANLDAQTKKGVIRVS